MVSRPRPRVFLDTNVLFSGLHSRLGAPNRILEVATAETIVCVVSMRVLQELTRNIRKKAPHLIGYLEQFLTGTPVEIVTEPLESEAQRWADAGFGSDAPIIAAAIAAGVDYFCTGDKGFLARTSAGVLGELHVVSPVELLRRLEQ